MTSDLIIAKVDRARLLLAEAKDAVSAKKVADMAHAAEIYAKRQKLSDESILYAHQIKVDALVLLGEFLKQMPKNKGAKAGGKRGSLRGYLREPRDKTPTLKASNITKRESRTAQRLATLARDGPFRGRNVGIARTVDLSGSERQKGDRKGTDKFFLVNRLIRKSLIVKWRTR